MIISDPTNLLTGTSDLATTFAAPVTLDTATKTITITPGSGTLPLASDGVTGQALYSALKILWRNNSTYIKFPFPMEAITPESFEFINGWVLANDTTRKALRTCGWAERNTSGGAIIRKYMGVLSLGDIGSSDISYYQWNTDTKLDFTFPGQLNEAIQIFGDGSNGSVDYTQPEDTLKLFNRIQGKIYSQSSKAGIGVSELGYIAYRFPLSNATDLNIDASDSHIASQITSMTGLTGTGNGTLYTFSKTAHGFDSGQRIVITGATPSTLNGIYTLQATGHTANAFVISSTETGALSAITSIRSVHSFVTFDSLAGTETHDVNEDTINETYKYIITDSANGVEGAATTQEIYEKIQWSLRQSTDISTGGVTLIGNTANAILGFVGSTLVGEPGVFIANLNASNYPFVEYYQLSDTTKTTKIVYPFISTGVINFGPNAGNGDFKFWMFYGDLTGDADYGKTGAVLVKDKNGNDITGTYSGSAYEWSFKYDGETAGGLRTVSTNTPVKVIGIGLTGGQWVSVDHVITKTTGQTILLAPNQERNYSNA